MYINLDDIILTMQIFNDTRIIPIEFQTMKHWSTKWYWKIKTLDKIFQEK